MTTNIPPPSRSAPNIPSRPARPTKHYPHLQDLIARTEDIHFRQRASIKSWIDVAEKHWTQAQAQKSFGSLDAAYVDYLLSFTIVAQIIPQCNEYSTFKTRASQDSRRYESLRQILRQNQGVYEAVKEEIKRDNLVSGVLSTEDQLRKVAQDAPRSKSQQKPEVRAKPPHLGGSAVPTSTGTLPRKAAPAPLLANGTTPKDDDLEARFNKLSTKPSSGMTAPSVAPAPTMPEGSTYRRNLNGPREMPPSKTNKLPPLDVSGHLPRMPPPTYSPATSYASPGGLSPKRSSTSRHPLAAVSQRDGVQQPAMEVSGDSTITADLLFKYLQGSSGLSVLLLDVRSRDEFNQGTIFGSSVVCIEPVSLREEMSGDELEETLVLAPSHEQDLFAKRHTFNVVVYYDQKTRDTSFMTASTTDERKLALRRLHFAICDYSYSKKLQRLPFLLEGGLDAWIELMGSPALKTFSPEVNKDSFPRRSLALRRTQAQRSPTPALVERSSYRLSQAINSSRPRQDVLSYDGAHHSTPAPPINIEEEEKWLAELQKESRPMTIAPPPPADSADAKKRRRAMSIVTQGTDPYPRTVEEFFQRYPSTPHGGDKESMVMPTAVHAEPEPSSPTTLTRRNTIIDHPFHGFSDVRNPDFHPPTSPSRPLPVAARKSYSGVSEKPLGPSERGSVPVTSGFTPFKAPLTGASAITVGNTGLKNLGNTCYMNSILQCMSGTTPLCRYFLDGSYKGHINRDNPLGSRGILAEAYATVIRHLWSGEYTFISPVTFKTVSGRLNETFKSNDQQDAQEFLDFLLDGLHEDLNPNANRTKLNPLTDEEERRRELLPLHVASHREWQRYTHQNCSVIVNWLQGQLSSRLRCLTCGTTSTTYNPFMYLSVPIPIRNATFTLDDCLKEFMKEETLGGDDAWNCPKCKQPRKATKKLTITRLPPILIVHLKRFTNRGRWGDKLNTPIEFSIDNLDLTRYFPTLPLGTEGVTREAETTPPFSYELYGVVNHFGTLQGGHYTAYVKNGMKTWYTFDDSRAVKMDEADVVTRNAYVLFFVRRSVF